MSNYSFGIGILVLARLVGTLATRELFTPSPDIYLKQTSLSDNFTTRELFTDQFVLLSTYKTRLTVSPDYLFCL